MMRPLLVSATKRFERESNASPKALKVGNCGRTVIFEE